MTTRRRFRASQVPQALLCPGSTQLIRRIRENQSSQAAHLGNWCHYTAAKTLVDFHGALPPDGGLIAPVMPEGFKPSNFGQWMADFHVQTVLTYADADMALLVEQEFSHTFKVKPYLLYDAKTGAFIGMCDEADLTGHIDAFAINADATEAVGGDLKSGPEHVDEAEQNAQVLTYMVLLKCAYPSLRKITFFIDQPQNNPDEGFERVTFATAAGDQLDGLVSYLERELNHSIDHENELNSDGWKQCRYCPVAATNQCPAIHGDYEIMKLTLTPEMIEAVKAEPTTEQLAALEIMRKKFTPIFDAGHEALKDRLELLGPQTAEGYRFYLETSPGRTKITDNAKAAEILAHVPDETYHTLYEFKKEPIEKALAAQESARTGQKIPHDSKVSGKTSGKSLFREQFAGITEQAEIKKLKMGAL